MKRIIILALAGLLAAACGTSTNVSNNSANNTNSNKGNAAIPSGTVAPTGSNVNSRVENTAAKSAQSGPKRISFAKGKTESVESVDLPPGESIQFILGATGAQTLFITPKSEQLAFRIVKGIAGELIKADDGVYSAETKGNNAAKGEIVFEVRNPTKAGIKTTITVAIEDFAD